MANKLTSKKLQELIMEVLSEQVLNEKDQSKYPFDADKEYFNPFGKKTTYKNYKYAKKDLGGTDRDVQNKIKALAKLDGNKTDLEVKDFDDVKTSDADELAATQAIANYGRKAAVRKPAEAALKALGTGSSYKGLKTDTWPHGSKFKDPNDLKTGRGKVSITKVRDAAEDAFNGGDKAIADDYVKYIMNNMNISATTQKIIDLVRKSNPGPNAGALTVALSDVIKSLNLDAADLENIFDPQDDEAETAIPQTQIPYHQVSDDDWRSGKNIDTSGVDNTTAQTFIAEISKHGDFLSLMKHYEGLMETIEGASDGKKSAINNLKKMDADDLFNSLTVLSTLEHIINTMQGSAAGTPLEVILALMNGGVVFGGAGHAADVLAGKKGEVLFSSKNTQLGRKKKKPDGSQAITNFHAMKLNDVIWYVGFGKSAYSSFTAKEAKGENIALKIHIVGVVRTASADTNTSFKIVNADGTDTGDTLGSKSPDNKYPIPFLSNPDVTIPLGSASTKRNRKNFNTIVNEAIKKANEKVQVAINGIYAKLENVKRQTQTFLALNKRGETGMDQATAAGKYYKDLKTDLSTGYEGVEKGAGAKFQENKNKSLKDLDKLIERVIIESMNKK